jgi:hypothetical protein
MNLGKHSLLLGVVISILTFYATLDYSAGGASVIGCAFQASLPSIEEPLTSQASDCAFNLGKHARTFGICSFLLSGIAVDTCKFGYAFHNDKSAVCSMAPSMQLSCYEDLAIEDNNINLCQNIKRTDEQQVCNNEVTYDLSHPEAKSSILEQSQ